MPSFDFNKMLQCIRLYRITTLFAVPPIILLMSKHKLMRQADLSSIELIGSGAAPLSPNVQREINRLVPTKGPALRQGWGMTEVTCTALSWDPTRPFNPGVGELMPGCQARLVKIETGAEITKANTLGELWIAGPSIMLRYWNNPIAMGKTILVDENGTRWLRTGDVAFVEEYVPGALFHIVGRYKELIKVDGYQVAPAELEALLLERPDVADAAVVGVKIGIREVPRAYIVRASQATTPKDEIITWLSKKVVRYKQLRGGVIFVPMIPKTPVSYLSFLTVVYDLQS